jgi:16S rRNA (cytosine967-C5)-methyltransferase
VRILQADLRRQPPCRPVFDLVLVDAPCSGLGTLRRDPDLRWRRAATDLAEFVASQRALLDAASEAVKPGGRLVYATCSSEPEENEEIIEWFLAEHPAFGSRDLRGALPDLAEDRRGVFTPEGYLRTSPHLHRLEAFFAAVVARERP